MVKKLLVVLALISSVGTANAVSAIRYNHRMQPMPYYNAYNAGYNAGYRHGKDKGEEKVVKAVVGTVLIATSAVIIYKLVTDNNPRMSDNINGHVRIAQF